MRAMSRFLGTLSVAVLLAGASNAYAVPEMELAKQVRQVTAGATSTVAVRPLGPSRTCVFSVIAFDATTPLGRIWYDTLLEALSTGATVDVLYDRNGLSCVVTNISIR